MEVFKISVYEKLEKWKDGSIRYVNRDSLGHFAKSIHEKFYTSQNVGVWNKEPQQKIVPEINHKEYVKGNFYRASISLNVPMNGKVRKPNYKNFTYVVVDLKDNIDMQDMHKELINEIQDKLHYKQPDFWFDSSFQDCDRQEPKPYSARTSSTTFEGTDY